MLLEKMEKETDVNGQYKRLIIALAALFGIAGALMLYGWWPTLQKSALILAAASAAAFALAYRLKSKGTLALALAAAITTITLQFLVFTKNADVAPGLLAISLLETGATIYGLSLLHRAKTHEFSGTYSWLSAAYLLLFAYVLSLQQALPSLWTVETATKEPAMLPVLLGIAAFLTLAFGINNAVKRGVADKREILGALVAFALLGTVIWVANLVTSQVELETGNFCKPRSCHDYQNQANCQGAPEDLECEWNQETNTCRQRGCYNYVDQVQCEKDKETRLKCQWSSGTCLRVYYACYWDGPCEPAGTETDKEPYYDRFISNFLKDCPLFTDEASCNRPTVCKWEPAPPKGGSIPPEMWALWISANLLVMGIILGVVSYGTWQKRPELVNLGIGFFALEIITRYIGFVQDRWGPMGLNLIFIALGMALIVGGTYLERWRKKLMSQASTSGG